MGRNLLKNGLEQRQHEERVSKIIGGVAFGYLALCFLAPLSLPSDSVPELSGRANAIDYAFETVGAIMSVKRGVRSDTISLYTVVNLYGVS